MTGCGRTDDLRLRVAEANRRAASAEQAVRRRHLRRLWGIPGTRLAVVAWPASVPQRLFFRWHYWWQAHFLDCLVDAQLRQPTRERGTTITQFVRGHLMRNMRWGNNYYDDIAWWGLALQRAGWQHPAALLAQRLATAVGPSGGIPWRRGDDFLNTPANGPAAILLARTGNLSQAADTAEWIDQQLRIAATDLIADGVHQRAASATSSEPGAGQSIVDETIYTYCQGVVLGAELELVVRGVGDPTRIHRLVNAIHTHLAPEGVLIGHGGGNGGLFSGILARYLVQVATRLPGSDAAATATRTLAATVVLSSAAAAWSGAVEVVGGPVFSSSWAEPSVVPHRTADPLVRGNAEVAASECPERDLSVQLAGWMLTEAAAAIWRSKPSIVA